MSRLTPGDVPRGGRPVRVIRGNEGGLTDESGSELPDDFEYENGGAEVVAEMIEKLEKLREPFPPAMIEKLPKPMWKGAWEGKRGAHCNICHGYHVLDDCIHLDYVGHANTTNRLLEADPFWEWEPMSLTEAGTPYFSDGGLWIRLTVCGVTRLGFGDGKNPKEIIGDAIRNAAMRFGVALDLWSKIDLHAERNPGDGPTSQSGRRRDTEGLSDSSSSGNDGNTVATDAPRRAPNQDALDELLHVCDANGLDPRAIEARYNDTLAPPQLVQASPDDIRNYAAILISECQPEPEGLDGSGPGEATGEVNDSVGTAEAGAAGTEVHGDAAEPVPADTGTEAAAASDGAEAGSVSDRRTDPTDTSDVEKKPGDIF